MVPPALDHAPQFGLELLLVDSAVLLSPRGHVLPDQQAQLVAPVVPAVRLDLDVLAGQLKPSFLVTSMS